MNRYIGHALGKNHDDDDSTRELSKRVFIRDVGSL